MRELLIIIHLVVFFTFNQVFAADTLTMPLNASLQSETVGSGLKVTLYDSYQVRPINQDNHAQLDKWYVDVHLVDGDNKKITDHKYRVSRRYYNKAVAVRIDGSMQGIAKSGKTLKFPSDSKYVIIGEGKKGAWNYYTLLRVNKDGRVLGSDGEIVKKDIGAQTFKISKATFDDEVFETQINKLSRMEHEVDYFIGPVQPKCPPENSGVPEKKPEKKPVVVVKPKPTPKPQIIATPKPKPQESWKDKCRRVGTWDCLKLNLRSWAKKGYNSCKKRVSAHEKEFNSLWKDDSLSKKSNKVHSGFKNSLKKIDAHGTGIGQNYKRKSPYGNMQNPYYIDPLVTSDVASCLAYQETHGTLSPQKVNYRVCKLNSRVWSTAIGIGQTTRGTIRGLRSNDGKNLLPITTIPGSPFKGKNGTYIHSKLADNPDLQYEVILRMFNYKVKYARYQIASYKRKTCQLKNEKKKKNCLAMKAKLAKIKTNDDILKRAVEIYDQDAKSKYLNRVMNKCLPCMRKLKAGGDALACHNAMDK